MCKFELLHLNQVFTMIQHDVKAAEECSKVSLKQSSHQHLQHSSSKQTLQVVQELEEIYTSGIWYGQPKISEQNNRLIKVFFQKKGKLNLLLTKRT